MNKKSQIFPLNINKGNELLPIGTVVHIGLVEQPVMIYGRKQVQAEKKVTWDYVACPYPQGHLSNDTNVFFNHSHIKNVMYKGLETEGELILRKKILKIDGEKNR